MQGGSFFKKKSGAGEKEYLYNKKELQEELGQYDYGARFYDPVIGRFGTIDPAGEKFYGLSSYSYVANNPILLNDQNGQDWTITMDTDKDGIKHYHVLFTGDVVNESKNKKIDGDAFASALTNQFNKLFNKSDTKNGYTIDGKAEISYVGDDRSNVAETHTTLAIVDRDDSDFDGDGATTPGKAINGMEVKFNADFVPGMMPDKNGKTANSKTRTHEIGHTGGLKHPDMDTYLFGLIPGSTNYSGPVKNGSRTIFPIESFMNQGGQGTWQWTHPTGPSKEQIQRIYDLYSAHKLNTMDQPIHQ